MQQPCSRDTKEMAAENDSQPGADVGTFTKGSQNSDADLGVPRAKLDSAGPASAPQSALTARRGLAQGTGAGRTQALKCSVSAVRTVPRSHLEGQDYKSTGPGPLEPVM